MLGSKSETKQNHVNPFKEGFNILLSHPIGFQIYQTANALMTPEILIDTFLMDPIEGTLRIIGIKHIVTGISALADELDRHPRAKNYLYRGLKLTSYAGVSLGTLACSPTPTASPIKIGNPNTEYSAIITLASPLLRAKFTPPMETRPETDQNTPPIIFLDDENVAQTQEQVKDFLNPKQILSKGLQIYSPNDSTVLPLDIYRVKELGIKSTFEFVIAQHQSDGTRTAQHAILVVDNNLKSISLRPVTHNLQDDTMVLGEPLIQLILEKAVKDGDITKIDAANIIALYLDNKYATHEFLIPRHSNTQSSAASIAFASFLMDNQNSDLQNNDNLVITPTQTRTPSATSTTAGTNTPQATRNILVFDATPRASATPSAAPSSTSTRDIATSTVTITPNNTSTATLAPITNTPTVSPSASPTEAAIPVNREKVAEALADKIVINFNDLKKKEIVKKQLIEILLKAPYGKTAKEFNDVSIQLVNVDYLQRLKEEWNGPDKYPNLNFTTILNTVSPSNMQELLQSLTEIDEVIGANYNTHWKTNAWNSIVQISSRYNSNLDGPRLKELLLKEIIASSFYFQLFKSNKEISTADRNKISEELSYFIMAYFAHTQNDDDSAKYALDKAFSGGSPGSPD